MQVSANQAKEVVLALAKAFGYYVGNVERYTDRKGFTECCWQMMRMPRIGELSPHTKRQNN